MRLRTQILKGDNPMAERKALREETTFGDLLDDYLDSDELRKKRMATQSEYRRIESPISRE